MDGYVTDPLADPTEMTPPQDGSEYENWTSFRTPEGRFRPGVSGNPDGRPRGSLNKTTLRMREAMEGEGPAIIYQLVEKAFRGDMQALRLVVPRIYPVQRERFVFLPLPEIHTDEDASQAISMVLAAIGDGQITPSEGQALVGMVEAKLRVMNPQRQQQKPETAAGKPKERAA
jgi:hypothetical protein